MKNIKIFKNFINLNDSYKIINYIDNNLDSFKYVSEYKRFTKMFGRDSFHKNKSTYPITGLKEIHDILFSAIETAKKTIAHEYQEKEDIFLTSLWLAKQIPGAYIGPHVDVDDGSNSHFVYSGVIYLNTLNNSGNLDFPRINLSIKPDAGDLIVFPSDGDAYFHEVKEIHEDRYNVPLIFSRNKDFELQFGLK